MRPLTDTTAKPLLRVNGKRLIDYHLEKIAAAGISRVVINTCWQANKITSEIGDGSRYGVQIDYSHEPTALETAGGIRQALHLLGERPFLVVSADIWCDVDYTELVHQSFTADAHLLMVENPDHNKQGDFAISPSGNLQLQPECPDAARDRSCTYSGIGLYHPDLFRTLEVTRYPLRDVLFPAIEEGRVSATLHQGQWFDVGTVDRLQQLDGLLRG